MSLVSERIEEHYARFLGMPNGRNPIKLPSNPNSQLQLLKYEDVPCAGAVTLATVGLSELPLHMFRQEFVFLCYKRFLSSNLVSLIAVVADMLSESKHPLLHGSILPPAGPLLDYTKMEALYVATLLYFDTEEEEFDVLRVDGLSILNSWLLPIYRSEAEWIDKHGYEAFESMIEDQDPDLMDLTRPPMV